MADIVPLPEADSCHTSPHPDLADLASFKGTIGRFPCPGSTDLTDIAIQAVDLASPFPFLTYLAEWFVAGGEAVP